MTANRRAGLRSGLRAVKRGLRVPFDSPAVGRTVDVEIDGHRMWSTRVPDLEGRVVVVPWPNVLSTHLVGDGEIVLRDQRSGMALASGRYSWPIAGETVGLRELAASRQIVDKWGKLTVAPSDALHHRLIAAMSGVFDDLHALGYTAAITGGTLLGAIRERRILAHDDDIDLLVYLGDATPSDVSIASYALERSLRRRGREIIRHSDAHLQIMFEADDSETCGLDLVHVDLFLGYHDRGVYSQPIAVRGRFEPGLLLPLTEVRLEGHSVPSVADGDAWLTLCYGPGWRTPDPGFRFRTPTSTRRRFENWFGVYDLNRDFWERHIRLDRSRPWRRDAARMLAATAPGDRVIDLGCGDGELAAVLAEAGREVLAADYARAAIAATSARPGVTAVRLNLADRRAVLEFIADELARGEVRHFLLSNVLASLTRETRANTFLLLRGLLGEESIALASFAVNPSFVYDHHRPDTWHLPLAWLREEASKEGLAIEVVARSMRSSSSGPRSVATVRIRKLKRPASPAREESG